MKKMTNVKKDIFMFGRAAHSEWYNSCFSDDKNIFHLRLLQLLCPCYGRVTIIAFTFQTSSPAFFLVFLVGWTHSTDLLENHRYKSRDKPSVHFAQTALTVTRRVWTPPARLCLSLSGHFWRLRASPGNCQPHRPEGDLGCQHPTGQARWGWHTVTNQRSPPLSSPATERKAQRARQRCRKGLVWNRSLLHMGFTSSKTVFHVQTSTLHRGARELFPLSESPLSF